LKRRNIFDPELDIDAAISNILWKDARRYRVSITVSETHSIQQARKRLFKGFDTSAPGGVERRRAETIHIPDLRQWMQQFAFRVIAHVKATVTDV
jgi:hypothetical protein